MRVSTQTRNSYPQANNQKQWEAGCCPFHIEAVSGRHHPVHRQSVGRTQNKAHLGKKTNTPRQGERPESGNAHQISCGGEREVPQRIRAPGKPFAAQLTLSRLPVGPYLPGSEKLGREKQGAWGKGLQCPSQPGPWIPLQKMPSPLLCSDLVGPDPKHEPFNPDMLIPPGREPQGQAVS